MGQRKVDVVIGLFEEMDKQTPQRTENYEGDMIFQAILKICSVHLNTNGHREISFEHYYVRELLSLTWVHLIHSSIIQGVVDTQTPNPFSFTLRR